MKIIGFGKRSIRYFIPPKLKYKLHPSYDDVYTIVTGMLIAFWMVLILYLPLLYVSEAFLPIILVSVCAISNCFFIKMGYDFKVPTYATFIVTLLVFIKICLDTGGIYSPYTGLFYCVLLTGLWAGRIFDYFSLLGCLICFICLCFLSIKNEMHIGNDNTPFEVLLFHFCLSLFTFTFSFYLRTRNEILRARFKEEQLMKIKELNRLVDERNRQLNNMRQELAADFHDETGNFLSAITHQASILQMDLTEQEFSFVKNDILVNSERLYASCKDFLWSINHKSENPSDLFDYLTSYAQNFFNRFDISFSVVGDDEDEEGVGLLPIYAARHIIFIFKEAMTNVVKHSGATEVVFRMEKKINEVAYLLEDNGQWKNPHLKNYSNGIANMKKRSEEFGFDFSILPTRTGTTVYLKCSLSHPEIEKSAL